MSGLGRDLTVPLVLANSLAKKPLLGRQAYFRNKQKNQSFNEILFLPRVPIHSTVAVQLYSFERFLNYSEKSTSPHLLAVGSKLLSQTPLTLSLKLPACLSPV